MIKWKKFCPGDKAIFMGDPDRITTPKGKKVECNLVQGKKYRIQNITFWGSYEFIRVEGEQMFWTDELFCSPKEWKEINKNVSELIK